MSDLWTEVGDRVFVRRYRFFDQDVVVVLGGDGALVVDTRYTPAQAREVLDDLRELGSPRVGVVVNTHGHGDHCNGNSVFRPAPIWGHERCATMIRVTGEAQRASGLIETPDVAADLAEVVLDPPDRTFTDRATLDLDGRIVELAYLGRGHTDNDIVVSIPDADVLCVGDLLENGAPPGSATATRWTGRRRPGRSWTSPASGRSSCPVTARTPIGRSWSGRSTRSVRSPTSRHASMEAGSTSRRPSPRRPTALPPPAKRSSGASRSFAASSTVRRRAFFARRTPMTNLRRVTVRRFRSRRSGPEAAGTCHVIQSRTRGSTDRRLMAGVRTHMTPANGRQLWICQEESGLGPPASTALLRDPHHPAAAGLAVDDRVERGLERRERRPP